MGTFKIINQSKGTDSGLFGRLSAEPGDRLSLYYNFGYDLQVNPNTRVHFVLREQNRDLVIYPEGEDIMNASGYVNPYMGEGLLAGTYTIYAYDEYYNQATSGITLTITAPAATCLKEGELNLPGGLDCCSGLESTILNPYCHPITVAPPESQCLKEGEYNFPYLGKTCCPGLETGYDLKCKPVAFVGTGIQAAIDYFVRAYGSQMPKCNQWGYIHANVEASVAASGGITWSQGGIGAVEDALRLKYPDIACAVQQPIIQPPGGVQRKCLDANTIAVWNQITGTYDTTPCGTGKVCKEGYCVDSITQPPPSGGGTKTMIQINTQKNMIGTVSLNPDGVWVWNITSPIVKSFGYGGKSAMPATWIDEQGNEQAAVIQKGGWGNGTLDVALDKGGSGVLAELYLKLSDVDIISQTPGYTIQLRYPKGAGMLQWALGLGIVGVAVAYIKKAKRSR